MISLGLRHREIWDAFGQSDIVVVGPEMKKHEGKAR